MNRLLCLVLLGLLAACEQEAPTDQGSSGRRPTVSPPASAPPSPSVALDAASQIDGSHAVDQVGERVGARIGALIIERSPQVDWPRIPIAVSPTHPVVLPELGVSFRPPETIWSTSHGDDWHFTLPDGEIRVARRALPEGSLTAERLLRTPQHLVDAARARGTNLEADVLGDGMLWLSESPTQVLVLVAVGDALVGMQLAGRATSASWREALAETLQTHPLLPVAMARLSSAVEFRREGQWVRLPEARPVAALTIARAFPEAVWLRALAAETDAAGGVTEQWLERREGATEIRRGALRGAPAWSYRAGDLSVWRVQLFDGGELVLRTNGGDDVLGALRFDADALAR